ncbi:MAG: DUF4091 domain-containing protein [Candidatus Manganitrophaceae bacterium]|nr:MAG: DUF4091 domain-containing protein [Candidatus Manganitrophaceae bacterium]
MNRWRKWVVLVSSFFLWGGIAEAQTIWWDTGMVKLRQANSGTTGDPIPAGVDLCTAAGCSRGGATLSAGRNEFEPFQIFIAAPAASGLSQVNVTITDLTDGRGNVIAALGASGRPKNIVLYREHYLPVSTASSSEGKTGLWPDGLVPKVDEYFGEVRRMPGETAPAFPFNVAAGQKQGIWVDLYVPPGTPAGLYKGSAQVTIGSAVAADIPIQLTVRNFDLPSVPSLKTAYAVGIGEVKTGHYGTAAVGNDKYWELLCLYTKEMLLHHVSNENILWPKPAWNSTLGKIDWSLPSISTTCNQRYPEFLSGGDPNLLPNGKLPGTKLTRARMRDGTGLSSTTVETSAYYKDYTRHIADMGWKSQLFYYLWDEPPYPSVSGVRRCDQNYSGVASTAWSDVYKKAKYFKDNGVDIPIMITSSRQASEDCFTNYLKVPDYTRYLDIWTVPNTWMNGKPGSNFPFNTNLRRSYDTIIAPGKELWWYQACGSHGCGGSETGYPTPMADLPAIYSRAYEWLTYQYQIGYAAPGPQTELYFETVYAYQFSTNDPWKNIYYFTGNGDGTYFYPGRPDKIGGTKHIPIPSIRLKMLREGIEDYEYLTQVEAKKNQEGVDGKAWIKANILDPYMAAVDPADGVSKLITYIWNKNPGSPTSSSGLLRAREELAKVLSTEPDFSIAATPTSSAVVVGSAATSTVMVSSKDGFNASVDIDCGTSHPTVTCSYNPNLVTPPVNGKASSLLTVTTQPTTPIGNHTVTVTGVSGDLSHPATFTVDVKAAPDFQLAVSPASVSTNAGSGAASSVAISSINSFNSPVGLTCTPSHPAVTCSFSAAAITPPVNGSASTALNIQTQAAASAGSYSVVVKGVSGALLRQATVALTVTANLPSAPVSDSFDRANSTALGGNWNEYLTDFEINANQLRNVDAAGQEAQWTRSIGANQEVSADCKVTATGNSCGVMARWSNANNYYYVRLDAGLGNVVLFKKVNGVFTALGTAARTIGYNSYYRLRLVVQGSALSVYFAGESTPAITLNDSSLPAGDYAGIRSYAAAAATTWFDNFNVLPLAGGSFVDSFDRASDGNLGANWSEYLPDFEINGNQVRNVDAAGQEARWTGSIGPDQDVSADCKVTATGNSCGVMARWSDANNFYYLRLDPGLGNVVLFKKVNGVYTSLGTAARPLAYDTFYRLRLVVKGNTLNAYFAAETAPAITLNDSSLSGGSYAGIRSYAAAAFATFFDNFKAAAP